MYQLTGLELICYNICKLPPGLPCIDLSRSSDYALPGGLP